MFLPKPNTCKKSESHERIKRNLKRPNVEAYLVLMLLVLQDFLVFHREF